MDRNNVYGGKRNKARRKSGPWGHDGKPESGRGSKMKKSIKNRKITTQNDLTLFLDEPGRTVERRDRTVQKRIDSFNSKANAQVQKIFSLVRRISDHLSNKKTIPEEVELFVKTFIGLKYLDKRNDWGHIIAPDHHSDDSSKLIFRQKLDNEIHTLIRVVKNVRIQHFEQLAKELQVLQKMIEQASEQLITGSELKYYRRHPVKEMTDLMDNLFTGGTRSHSAVDKNLTLPMIRNELFYKFRMFNFSKDMNWFRSDFSNYTREYNKTVNDEIRIIKGQLKVQFDTETKRLLDFNMANVTNNDLGKLGLIAKKAYVSHLLGTASSYYLDEHLSSQLLTSMDGKTVTGERLANWIESLTRSGQKVIRSHHAHRNYNPQMHGVGKVEHIDQFKRDFMANFDPKQEQEATLMFKQILTLFLEVKTNQHKAQTSLIDVCREIDLKLLRNTSQISNPQNKIPNVASYLRNVPFVVDWFDNSAATKIVDVFESFPAVICGMNTADMRYMQQYPNNALWMSRATSQNDLLPSNFTGQVNKWQSSIKVHPGVIIPVDDYGRSDFHYVFSAGTAQQHLSSGSMFTTGAHYYEFIFSKILTNQEFTRDKMYRGGRFVGNPYLGMLFRQKETMTTLMRKIEASISGVKALMNILASFQDADITGKDTTFNAKDVHTKLIKYMVHSSIANSFDPHRQMPLKINLEANRTGVGAYWAPNELDAVRTSKATQFHPLGSTRSYLPPVGADLTLQAGKNIDASAGGIPGMNRMDNTTADPFKSFTTFKHYDRVLTVGVDNRMNFQNKQSDPLLNWQTDFYKEFSFALASIPVPKQSRFEFSSQQVSGFSNQDFAKTDQIFIMIVKSLLTKILIALGLYKLKNNLDVRSRSTFSEIRGIIGGTKRMRDGPRARNVFGNLPAMSSRRKDTSGNVGRETSLYSSSETDRVRQQHIRSRFSGVRIIPEATELYVRIPLLLEWYKELFREHERKTKNSDRNFAIAYIPYARSEFSDLIHFVFVETDFIEDGSYGDHQLRKLIKLINTIYQSHGGRHSCRDIIIRLVLSINNQYGVIKVQDIRNYYKHKRYQHRDEGFDVNNPAKGNYDILDSGNDRSVSDHRTDFSLSAQNERELFQRINSKYNPNYVSMVMEFRRSVMHCLSVDTDHLTSKFKPLHSLAFKNDIRRLSRDLNSARDETSKVEILKKSIQGIYELQNSNGIYDLMFNEMVSAPLSILYGCMNLLEEYNGFIHSTNLKANAQAIMQTIKDSQSGILLQPTDIVPYVNNLVNALKNEKEFDQSDRYLNAGNVYDERIIKQMTHIVKYAPMGETDFSYYDSSSGRAVSFAEFRRSGSKDPVEILQKGFDLNKLLKDIIRRLSYFVGELNDLVHVDVQQNGLPYLDFKTIDGVCTSILRSVKSNVQRFSAFLSEELTDSLYQSKNDNLADVVVISQIFDRLFRNKGGVGLLETNESIASTWNMITKMNISFDKAFSELIYWSPQNWPGRAIKDVQGYNAIVYDETEFPFYHYKKAGALGPEAEIRQKAIQKVREGSYVEYFKAAFRNVGDLNSVKEAKEIISRALGHSFNAKLYATLFSTSSANVQATGNREYIEYRDTRQNVANINKNDPQSIRPNAAQATIGNWDNTDQRASQERWWVENQDQSITAPRDEPAVNVNNNFYSDINEPKNYPYPSTQPTEYTNPVNFDPRHKNQKETMSTHVGRWSGGGGDVIHSLLELANYLGLNTNVVQMLFVLGRNEQTRKDMSRNKYLKRLLPFVNWIRLAAFVTKVHSFRTTEDGLEIAPEFSKIIAPADDQGQGVVQKIIELDELQAALKVSNKYGKGILAVRNGMKVRAVSDANLSLYYFLNLVPFAARVLIIFFGSLKRGSTGHSSMMNILNTYIERPDDKIPPASGPSFMGTYSARIGFSINNRHRHNFGTRSPFGFGYSAVHAASAADRLGRSRGEFRNERYRSQAYEGQNVRPSMQEMPIQSLLAGQVRNPANFQQTAGAIVKEHTDVLAKITREADVPFEELVKAVIGEQENREEITRLEKKDDKVVVSALDWMVFCDTKEMLKTLDILLAHIMFPSKKKKDFAQSFGALCSFILFSKYEDKLLDKGPYDRYMNNTSERLRVNEPNMKLQMDAERFNRETKDTEESDLRHSFERSSTTTSESGRSTITRVYGAGKNDRENARELRHAQELRNAQRMNQGRNNDSYIPRGNRNATRQRESGQAGAARRLTRRESNSAGNNNNLSTDFGDSFSGNQTKSNENSTDNNPDITFKDLLLDENTSANNGDLVEQKRDSIDPNAQTGTTIGPNATITADGAITTSQQNSSATPAITENDRNDIHVETAYIDDEDDLDAMYNVLDQYNNYNDNSIRPNNRQGPPSTYRKDRLANVQMLTHRKKQDTLANRIPTGSYAANKGPLNINAVSGISESDYMISITAVNQIIFDIEGTTMTNTDYLLTLVSIITSYAIACSAKGYDVDFDTSFTNRPPNMNAHVANRHKLLQRKVKPVHKRETLHDISSNRRPMNYESVYGGTKFSKPFSTNDQKLFLVKIHQFLQSTKTGDKQVTVDSIINALQADADGAVKILDGMNKDLIINTAAVVFALDAKHRKVLNLGLSFHNKGIRVGSEIVPVTHFGDFAHQNDAKDIYQMETPISGTPDKYNLFAKYSAVLWKENDDRIDKHVKDFPDYSRASFETPVKMNLKSMSQIGDQGYSFGRIDNRNLIDFQALIVDNMDPHDFRTTLINMTDVHSRDFAYCFSIEGTVIHTNRKRPATRVFAKRGAAAYNRLMGLFAIYRIVNARLKYNEANDIAFSQLVEVSIQDLSRNVQTLVSKMSVALSNYFENIAEQTFTFQNTVQLPDSDGIGIARATKVSSKRAYDYYAPQSTKIYKCLQTSGSFPAAAVVGYLDRFYKNAETINIEVSFANSQRKAYKYTDPLLAHKTKYFSVTNYLSSVNQRIVKALNYFANMTTGIVAAKQLTHFYSILHSSKVNRSSYSGGPIRDLGQLAEYSYESMIKNMRCGEMKFTCAGTFGNVSSDIVAVFNEYERNSFRNTATPLIQQTVYAHDQNVSVGVQDIDMQKLNVREKMDPFTNYPTDQVIKQEHYIPNTINLEHRTNFNAQRNSDYQTYQDNVDVFGVNDKFENDRKSANKSKATEIHRSVPEINSNLNNNTRSSFGSPPNFTTPSGFGPNDVPESSGSGFGPNGVPERSGFGSRSGTGFGFGPRSMNVGHSSQSTHFVPYTSYHGGVGSDNIEFWLRSETELVSTAQMFLSMFKQKGILNKSNFDLRYVLQVFLKSTKTPCLSANVPLNEAIMFINRCYKDLRRYAATTRNLILSPNRGPRMCVTKFEVCFGSSLVSIFKNSPLMAIFKYILSTHTQSRNSLIDPPIGQFSDLMTLEGSQLLSKAYDTIMFYIDLYTHVYTAMRTTAAMLFKASARGDQDLTGISSSAPSTAVEAESWSKQYMNLHSNILLTEVNEAYANVQTQLKFIREFWAKYTAPPETWCSWGIYRKGGIDTRSIADPSVRAHAAAISAHRMPLSFKADEIRGGGDEEDRDLYARKHFGAVFSNEQDTQALFVSRIGSTKPYSVWVQEIRSYAVSMVNTMDAINTGEVTNMHSFYQLKIKFNKIIQDMPTDQSIRGARIHLLVMLTEKHLTEFIYIRRTFMLTSHYNVNSIPGVAREKWVEKHGMEAVQTKNESDTSSKHPAGKIAFLLMNRNGAGFTNTVFKSYLGRSIARSALYHPKSGKDAVVSTSQIYSIQDLMKNFDKMLNSGESFPTYLTKLTLFSCPVTGKRPQMINKLDHGKILPEFETNDLKCSTSYLENTVWCDIDEYSFISPADYQPNLQHYASPVEYLYAIKCNVPLQICKDITGTSRMNGITSLKDLSFLPGLESFAQQPAQVTGGASKYSSKLRNRTQNKNAEKIGNYFRYCDIQLCVIWLMSPKLTDGAENIKIALKDWYALHEGVASKYLTQSSPKAHINAMCAYFKNFALTSAAQEGIDTNLNVEELLGDFMPFFSALTTCQDSELINYDKDDNYGEYSTVDSRTAASPSIYMKYAVPNIVSALIIAFRCAENGINAPVGVDENFIIDNLLQILTTLHVRKVDDSVQVFDVLSFAENEAFKKGASSEWISYKKDTCNPLRDPIKDTKFVDVCYAWLSGIVVLSQITHVVTGRKDKYRNLRKSAVKILSKYASDELDKMEVFFDANARRMMYSGGGSSTLAKIVKGYVVISPTLLFDGADVCFSTAISSLNARITVDKMSDICDQYVSSMVHTKNIDFSHGNWFSGMCAASARLLTTSVTPIFTSITGGELNAIETAAISQYSDMVTELTATLREPSSTTHDMRRQLRAVVKKHFVHYFATMYYVRFSDDSKLEKYLRTYSLLDGTRENIYLKFVYNLGGNLNAKTYKTYVAIAAKNALRNSVDASGWFVDNYTPTNTTYLPYGSKSAIPTIVCGLNGYDAYSNFQSGHDQQKDHYKGRLNISYTLPVKIGTISKSKIVVRYQKSASLDVSGAQHTIRFVPNSTGGRFSGNQVVFSEYSIKHGHNYVHHSGVIHDGRAAINLQNCKVVPKNDKLFLQITTETGHLKLQKENTMQLMTLMQNRIPGGNRQVTTLKNQSLYAASVATTITSQVTSTTNGTLQAKMFKSDTLQQSSYCFLLFKDLLSGDTLLQTHATTYKVEPDIYDGDFYLDADHNLYVQATNETLRNQVEKIALSTVTSRVTQTLFPYFSMFRIGSLCTEFLKYVPLRNSDKQSFLSIYRLFLIQVDTFNLLKAKAVQVLYKRILGFIDIFLTSISNDEPELTKLICFKIIESIHLFDKNDKTQPLAKLSEIIHNNPRVRDQVSNLAYEMSGFRLKWAVGLMKKTPSKMAYLEMIQRYDDSGILRMSQTKQNEFINLRKLNAMDGFREDNSIKLGEFSENNTSMAKALVDTINILNETNGTHEFLQEDQTADMVMTKHDYFFKDRDKFRKDEVMRAYTEMVRRTEIEDDPRINSRDIEDNQEYYFKTKPTDHTYAPMVDLTNLNYIHLLDHDWTDEQKETLPLNRSNVVFPPFTSDLVKVHQNAFNEQPSDKNLKKWYIMPYIAIFELVNAEESTSNRSLGGDSFKDIPFDDRPYLHSSMINFAQLVQCFKTVRVKDNFVGYNRLETVLQHPIKSGDKTSTLADEFKHNKSVYVVLRTIASTATMDDAEWQSLMAQLVVVPILAPSVVQVYLYAALVLNRYSLNYSFFCSYGIDPLVYAPTKAGLVYVFNCQFKDIVSQKNNLKAPKMSRRLEMSKPNPDMVPVVNVPQLEKGQLYPTGAANRSGSLVPYVVNDNAFITTSRNEKLITMLDDIVDGLSKGDLVSFDQPEQYIPKANHLLMHGGGDNPLISGDSLANADSLPATAIVALSAIIARIENQQNRARYASYDSQVFWDLIGDGTGATGIMGFQSSVNHDGVEYDGRLNIHTHSDIFIESDKIVRESRGYVARDSVMNLVHNQMIRLIIKFILIASRQFMKDKGESNRIWFNLTSDQKELMSVGSHAFSFRTWMENTYTGGTLKSSGMKAMKAATNAAAQSIANDTGDIYGGHRDAIYGGTLSRFLNNDAVSLASVVSQQSPQKILTKLKEFFLNETENYQELIALMNIRPPDPVDFWAYNEQMKRHLPVSYRMPFYNGDLKGRNSAANFDTAGGLLVQFNRLVAMFLQGCQDPHSRMIHTPLISHISSRVSANAAESYGVLDTDLEIEYIMPNGAIDKYIEIEFATKKSKVFGMLGDPVNPGSVLLTSLATAMDHMANFSENAALSAKGTMYASVDNWEKLSNHMKHKLETYLPYYLRMFKMIVNKSRFLMQLLRYNRNLSLDRSNFTACLKKFENTGSFDLTNKYKGPPVYGVFEQHRFRAREDSSLAGKMFNFLKVPNLKIQTHQISAMPNGMYLYAIAAHVPGLTEAIWTSGSTLPVSATSLSDGVNGTPNRTPLGIVRNKFPGIIYLILPPDAAAGLAGAIRMRVTSSSKWIEITNPIDLNAAFTNLAAQAMTDFLNFLKRVVSVRANDFPRSRPGLTEDLQRITVNSFLQQFQFPVALRNIPLTRAYVTATDRSSRTILHEGDITEKLHGSLRNRAEMSDLNRSLLNNIDENQNTIQVGDPSFLGTGYSSNSGRVSVYKMKSLWLGGVRSSKHKFSANTGYLPYKNRSSDERLNYLSQMLSGISSMAEDFVRSIKGVMVNITNPGYYGDIDEFGLSPEVVQTSRSYVPLSTMLISVCTKFNHFKYNLWQIPVHPVGSPQFKLMKAVRSVLGNSEMTPTIDYFPSMRNILKSYNRSVPRNQQIREEDYENQIVRMVLATRFLQDIGCIQTFMDSSRRNVVNQTLFEDQLWNPIDMYLGKLTPVSIESAVDTMTLALATKDKASVPIDFQYSMNLDQLLVNPSVTDYMRQNYNEAEFQYRLDVMKTDFGALVAQSGNKDESLKTILDRFKESDAATIQKENNSLDLTQNSLLKRFLIRQLAPGNTLQIRDSLSLFFNSSKDNVLHLISKKLQGSQTNWFGKNLGKKKQRHMLRVFNFLDLNIFPINVHALMKEIPLVNVINYSQTFDEMVCNFFKINPQEKKIDTVDLPGLRDSLYKESLKRRQFGNSLQSYRALPTNPNVNDNSLVRDDAKEPYEVQNLIQGGNKNSLLHNYAEAYDMSKMPHSTQEVIARITLHPYSYLRKEVYYTPLSKIMLGEATIDIQQPKYNRLVLWGQILINDIAPMNQSMYDNVNIPLDTLFSNYSYDISRSLASDRDGNVELDAYKSGFKTLREIATLFDQTFLRDNSKRNQGAGTANLSAVLTARGASPLRASDGIGIMCVVLSAANNNDYDTLLRQINSIPDVKKMSIYHGRIDTILKPLAVIDAIFGPHTTGNGACAIDPTKTNTVVDASEARAILSAVNAYGFDNSTFANSVNLMKKLVSDMINNRGVFAALDAAYARTDKLKYLHSTTTDRSAQLIGAIVNKRPGQITVGANVPMHSQSGNSTWQTESTLINNDFSSKVQDLNTFYGGDWNNQQYDPNAQISNQSSIASGTILPESNPITNIDLRIAGVLMVLIAPFFRQKVSIPNQIQDVQMVSMVSDLDNLSAKDIPRSERNNSIEPNAYIRESRKYIFDMDHRNTKNLSLSKTLHFIQRGMGSNMNKLNQIKEIQLEPANRPELKYVGSDLREMGRARYDTKLVRMLEWIVNLQRFYRVYVKETMQQINTPVINSTQIVNPKTTDDRFDDQFGTMDLF